MRRFQCSSASRKFLNSSESIFTPRIFAGFSALQRAENSSISRDVIDNHSHRSFSALQRAENSSIGAARRYGYCVGCKFQCSSASRKFLNARRARWLRETIVRFSALQRAENSSIAADADRMLLSAGFSALQRAENSSMTVSISSATACASLFQCSSASRKFLNGGRGNICRSRRRFQCSSASRKFLNSSAPSPRRAGNWRFSALQRAENSSIWTRHKLRSDAQGFSALQRAENSSIFTESSESSDS